MTITRALPAVVLAGAALGAAASGAAPPPEGDAARARVGRRAGTVEGFTRYSEALVRATAVWDAGTLDRWLEDPQTVVPGNLMAFPGLKDARQRADLAAGPKRPDLKTVGPERRVTAIRHCGDGYHVTTEDGRTVPFWEFNLRFKTDSSSQGPPPGRPALVPAGMQGDRASIVFAAPGEISRAVEEKCQ